MTVIWAMLAALAGISLVGAVVAALLRPATNDGAYHEELRWRLFAEGTWAALLTVTMLLLLLLGLLFLSGNWLSLLFSTSTLVPIMLAAPAALIVARGGFDFSIAGTAVLCATVIALLSDSLGDVSPLAGVVLGAIIGLVNGVLVAVTRVSPVLLTLGVGISARGFAGYLSSGMQVTPRLSGYWDSPAVGVVLTVLVGLWVLAIAALGLFTRVGRQDLRSPARDESLPQRLVTLGLPLALSGMAAGVAGMVLVLRFRAAGSGMLMGTEAEVALAVLAGGTCLGGRHPMVIGAALAGAGVALLMRCLMLMEATLIMEWMEGGIIVAAALASQAHASIWTWAYRKKRGTAARAFPVGVGQSTSLTPRA